MNNVRAFPTLYGRDSKDRIKVWQIGVVQTQSGTADIFTEHGLEGGTMQTATVHVREGKNLGRANETTPFEQAVKEAEAKWTKQRDQKGYREDKSALDELPLRPMLAHRYDKRAHNIKWPAYVQPKLDGIRMIATVRQGSVDYVTRNGKPLTTVPHLTDELLQAFAPGTIVDGELFNPEMVLQDIVSGAKRASEKSARLQFWIYDLVDDRQFLHRSATIEEALLPGLFTHLVRVATQRCDQESEMRDLHMAFVRGGYEGTIIRNAAGRYARGKRSADLQKVKDFHDEEFTIVGGKDGVGKEEGCVTFHCVTADGVEFDVRPRGTEEQRRAWYRDLDQLVGKKLTVRYFNFTPDGKPFHPVGVAIRDYE